MPTSIFPINEFVTNTEDQDRLDSQPTNKYFNWHNDTSEQQLYASQVAEMIQSHGQEMVYLPRSLQNVDVIFGEDPTNSFTNAYRFAIAIDNILDYIGPDNTFTNQAYTWDAEIDCTVERSLFGYQVPIEIPNFGDLVYWPLAKVLFEITWVSQIKGEYFQLGSNPTIRIKMEKHTYSGETIEVSNTGIYQEEHYVCSIPEHTDQLSCELAGGTWTPSFDGDAFCSDPQYTDQATCELNGETWTPAANALIPEINQITGKTDVTNSDENEFTQTEGDTYTNDEEDNPFGIKI